MSNRVGFEAPSRAGHDVTQPQPRQTGQLRHLIRASHPRQALVFAALVATATAVDGRGFWACLTAGAAVGLVQLSLGLHNDVCDQEHDYRGELDHKPVAAGWLPAGNATYVMMILILVAIPMSMYSGTVAGLALLATLPVGWVSNKWLHRTFLSPIPWMITMALYTGFISYGGWGLGVHGGPPHWLVVTSAAILGICVHFLLTLPDLISDHKTGARNLPLRLALRLGAPKVLLITLVMTVLATASLFATLAAVGLRM